MVDYRHMGNMEMTMGNARSTTFLHQMRDLWKSPRGTVLRIEALALVAIALSFLLAAFGSCRRWSNRWIIQKGFLAANALSLSLGTYSIGLMQSSSVKSEMYPIWAVSLLTLFGCVDSITTYNGLDYMSPLFKMTFQLCLYCGYVLLMSISAISSDIGKISICMLSVITFIKGFHRSLALVLPSNMRNVLRELVDGSEKYALPHICGYSEQYNLQYLSDCDTLKWLKVELPLDSTREVVDMGEIHIRSWKHNGGLWSDVAACHDVCVAFSLSHILQRRFLGLTDVLRTTDTYWFKCRVIDYKRMFKVIEVELAFLYEVFFTSSAFIHFYQAKTASFWAVASLVGICFVAVVAGNPVMRTSRRAGGGAPNPAAATIVLDTTTADLIITIVILVSLALLQLVQLIRCWTSNWARVAFACEYARNEQKQMRRTIRLWLWWMRLKGFAVARINWFDHYLWQEKLGQYSIAQSSSRRGCRIACSGSASRCRFGLQYIGRVFLELLGRDTDMEAAVRLHADVKASIGDFLGQIKSGTTGEDWSSLFVANGVMLNELPYTPAFPETTYTTCVLMWHIATCYCERVQQKQDDEERPGCRQSVARSAAAAAAAACFNINKNKTRATGEAEKNRRVANALSNYCAYLVVSAPELLPGTSQQTKRVLDGVVWQAKQTLQWERLETLRPDKDASHAGTTFWKGVALGKRLLCSDDPWKVLALFWVQALLYAAPYGEVDVHMQRLSQGGEFITHIWALLHHAGIYNWKHA